MVQFNLVPDVKLQYIKATRTKHVITFISMVTAGAALAIMLILLFTVKVIQARTISSLNDNIKTYGNQLKSTPNLDRMLTVQNQLSTLTSLHEKKPAVSRVYKYVSYMPKEASLNHMTLDFATNTLTLAGNAASLDAINTYATSLKNTTFTTKTDDTGTKAYSEVVLSSFAKTEKGATFTLTMKFNPTLFDITQEVNLVPGATGEVTTNAFTKVE